MYDNLLWTKCDIYRDNLVAGTDSIGGYTRTVVLTYSNIPCNLQYLSGEEMVIYGKNQVSATHRLFMCCSYEIKSTDLIKIDSDYYDVAYIDNSIKKYHHLEILLRLAKAPQIFYPDSSSSDTSSSSSYIEEWSSSSSSSD